MKYAIIFIKHNKLIFNNQQEVMKNYIKNIFQIQINNDSFKTRNLYKK